MWRYCWCDSDSSSTAEEDDEGGYEGFDRKGCDAEEESYGEESTLLLGSSLLPMMLKPDTETHREREREREQQEFESLRFDFWMVAGWGGNVSFVFWLDSFLSCLVALRQRHLLNLNFSCLDCCVRSKNTN